MARKLEHIDAKRIYIEECLEVVDIAKRLNVPEATVYRWKSDDLAKGCDWDKEREEIKFTSFSAEKKSLQAFNKRLEKILADVSTGDGRFQKGDMYELRQLQIIISNFIQKDDTLGNMILWGNKFTAFMQGEDPELLDKLIPHLQKFGKVMIEETKKAR